VKEVGVYDAKTRLTRLLDEVEQGETITITRHGRPVAQLVPIGTQRARIEQTIKEFKEFAKAHPLKGITIRELIEEGRRR
jgi:prevent-host-death family protein